MRWTPRLYTSSTAQIYPFRGYRKPDLNETMDKGFDEIAYAEAGALETTWDFEDVRILKELKPPSLPNVKTENKK